MIDINLPLRKAYYNALVATGLPVFYGEAPDDITAQVYIVFSAINSNDASTFTSFDTNTTIQIKIHSWVNKYNPVIAPSNAAALVYGVLLPTPGFNLDTTADGMQIVSTVVNNDFEQELGTLAGRKYSDRVIIFNHKIFIL